MSADEGLEVSEKVHVFGSEYFLSLLDGGLAGEFVGIEFLDNGEEGVETFKGEPSSNDSEKLFTVLSVGVKGVV